MIKKLMTIAVLFTPAVALAHPDHLSGGSFGTEHVLTSPFHLALAAAAVLLFIVARRFVLRRSARQRLTAR